MKSDPPSELAVSSLEEYDDLAGRIRMHRNGKPGEAILIVEGESDEVVLAPILPGVRLFRAGSKQAAISCCTRLTNWAICERIRAVVDRDFDDDQDNNPDLVIFYSGRDLEHMLIEVGVLHHVLPYAGSREKIQKAGGVDRVVDLILSGANPITALRVANHRRGWSLRFDAVDPSSKMICKQSLALNVLKYCNSLDSHSDNSPGSKALIEIANRARNDPPRGKDAMIFAGVALRGLVGSRSAQAAAEPIVTSQLRSSAAALLRDSDWFDRLRTELFGEPAAASHEDKEE